MDPNLRAVGVGSVVRATGLSLIGPFFTLYLRNVLGIGYVEIGLLLVLVGVPPLVVSAAGGLLADRVGRRRLFLVSLFGEAATLFAVATAMGYRSLTGVVVGIAALAIVSTLGGPALSAYVADFSVGSERTLAFTWIRVGHNVGFTLGTLAGGALIALVGFVSVGAVAGAVGLASALWLSTSLRPSSYDRRLALGRSTLEGSVPDSVRPGSVRESLAALAHDRTFLTLCVAIALAQVVIGQWVTAFPLFAYRNLGISYGLFGAGLALNGLIVVFGQTTTTRLALGHRHTTIAILAVALYAVAFLGLGVAGAWSLFPVASFFVVVSVLTIGENLSSIPYQTLPSNLAPPSEVGAYNGAFSTLTGLGPLFAALLGGFALASIQNPLLLWAVLVAPALPAVVLLRWTGGRMPRTADRA